MRNILMIVVDCARTEKTIADFPLASPATCRSADMPFLDALRNMGTTWSNFHSVSSTTTPNFASMFTGLLPLEHGIIEHSRHALRTDLPTLAWLLLESGYNTYAECTGPLIPETGLDRGFAHYRYRERHEYLHTGFYPYLKDTVPSLPEPWFLVLHFWEAHEPYQALSRFAEARFGVTPYDRALSLVDYYLFALLKETDLSNISLIYTSDHGERLAPDYQLNNDLGGSEKDILELFESFRAQNHTGQFDFDGWFQLALRELGEVKARIYAHNVLGHGFHLTEELIRIPLVIVDKERCKGGAVNHSLRSQTDLFATILDLAGLDDQTRSHPDSKSLFDSEEQEMIYIEANGSGGKQCESRCYLRGATTGRWKYWRIDAGKLEHRVLWDLENDPREINNVIDSNPGVAGEMERFVNERMAATGPFIETGEAQAAAIEQKLKDLGYL